MSNSKQTSPLPQPTAFKRAHGEEQKQIRITQFLDAAAALYEELGYEQVSLTKISEKLNFHRNNVYNYFNCKEDLFLTLLLQDYTAMVEDAIKTFLPPMEDQEKIAQKFTSLYLRHQRMLELLSLANTTILVRASANIHKRYRKQLHELTIKLQEHLQANILTDVEPQTVLWLCDNLTVYAVGLYPASLQYKERHDIAIYPDKRFGSSSFEEVFTPYVKLLLDKTHS